MPSIPTIDLDELADSMRDRFPDQSVAIVRNQWGGIDARSQTRTLRVVPADGEWEAGCDVHVMRPNALVLRSATLGATNYPSTIVAVASALLADASDEA